MIYTVFFALLCVLSLVMLIRQIVLTSERDTIAGALLADEKLNFILTENGKYTIWTKRIAQSSFRKRGVHNYSYELIHKASGQVIPLSKQKDDSDIINNRRARQPWIEGRWKTHYSFEAPAGAYELSFKKSVDVSTTFEGLGIFNPFKEINAEKYTVEVTPYYNKFSELKNGMIMAFYFVMMFLSLIFLFKEG